MSLCRITVLLASALSVAIADGNSNFNPTEKKIAKEYGTIRIDLPNRWKIQRHDAGWEESDTTFYMIAPAEYFDEANTAINDEDRPPYVLLSFERQIRQANPGGRKPEHLISGLERGRTKGGLRYSRWKTRGPNFPVSNGTADLDGRFVHYHFSDLPFQLSVTAKFNRWQEKDLPELLEEIVNSLTVNPAKTEKPK